MDKNELRKIMEDNYNLAVSKNKDYSGDNIAIEGLKGVIVRIVDKVSRLRHLVNSNDTAAHESIDDTLRDLSNYGNIGILIKKGKWYRGNKMVYLAGPNDDIDSSQSNGWRNYISDKLNKHNICTFNPVTAFNNSNFQASHQIVEINKYAISKSDVVIAYLSGPGKGIGTIREIEYAVSIGKQVIVIFDDESRISLYDCIVVKSIDDAVQYVTMENNLNE